MADVKGLDATIFSSRNVKANGVKIHYVIGGQGPIILLWHGFLATWFSWRKVMPSLAKNYTVVALDMRGYGDSEKPASGYDARTLVEDARALIHQLGVTQKITIVAHDMGAPPALIYAGEYPDEVKALVYFENPVLTSKNMQMLHTFTQEGTKKGGLWWWNFAFATDMPQRLIVGKEREFLTWFFQGATHDNGVSIEETAVAEYVRTFSGDEGVRGSFGIYREIFASIKQTEKFDGLLSKIGVPVLALGGELGLGKLVKPMVEGVASHVQGEVVSNCGHFIQEEQPEHLLKLISEFMATVNS